jgi:hypothetical protein
MLQLTKPELLKGQLVMNLQVSNDDIKYIHEALAYYVQNHPTKNNESIYLGIQELREELLHLRRILNPS